VQERPVRGRRSLELLHKGPAPSQEQALLQVLRPEPELEPEQPLELEPEQPLELEPEQPLELEPEQPLELEPEQPLELEPEQPLESVQVPRPELEPRELLQARVRRQLPERPGLRVPQRHRLCPAG
jgi:hypothetical protein